MLFKNLIEFSFPFLELLQRKKGIKTLNPLKTLGKLMSKGIKVVKGDVMIESFGPFSVQMRYNVKVSQNLRYVVDREKWIYHLLMDMPLKKEEKEESGGIDRVGKGTFFISLF